MFHLKKVYLYNRPFQKIYPPRRMNQKFVSIKRDNAVSSGKCNFHSISKYTASHIIWWLFLPKFRWWFLFIYIILKLTKNINVYKIRFLMRTILSMCYFAKTSDWMYLEEKKSKKFVEILEYKNNTFPQSSYPTKTMPRCWKFNFINSAKTLIFIFGL